MLRSGKGAKRDGGGDHDEERQLLLASHGDSHGEAMGSGMVGRRRGDDMDTLLSVNHHSQHGQQQQQQQQSAFEMSSQQEPLFSSSSYSSSSSSGPTSIDGSSAADGDDGDGLHAKSWRNWIAFWIFGLCNNFGYVIMLSGAHDILKKLDPNLGTGAVLLADILPTLIIKLFGGPIIVYRMPYTLRITVVTLFAILSFVLVGVAESVGVALFGVVCASISSGLGEISFLSMTSCYHKNVVSAWSSGTGGAGAIGASVYLGLTAVLSPSDAQFAMLFVPLLLIGAYFFLLTHKPVSYIDTSLKNKEQFTTRQKLTMTKRLILPYMLPLFFVYWAEYSINQGIFENLLWKKAFIGTDAQYRLYQLIYQIGVFLSRSSLPLFPLRTIWVPSILQIINLAVLLADARHHFIPSIYIHLVWIFYEGLLGGITYVNAFALISKHTISEHREYSMTVASVGDTFGISLAGACALGINKFLKPYSPR